MTDASTSAEVDELLTPSQIAETLKVQPSTLVRWRRLRQGPPWIRVGHRTVRYPASAFEAWMKARTAKPLAALPRLGGE